METKEKVLNYFREHKGASANDCAKWLSEENGTVFSVTNVCNILNRLSTKKVISIPQDSQGRNDYANLKFL